MPLPDDPWSRFAAALRDRRAPVPDDWVDPSGRASARRFGVYRNNVVAGLAGVLGDAYPVVRALVGDAFFHRMACAYVETELPRVPMLHDYGGGFASFIDAFEPASSLPYLADVARIERAGVEAYHACDAAAWSSWDSLRDDDVERVRLTLHPSARVVRSAFPARTIWTLHQGVRSPAPITLGDDPQDTLIVRPDAQVTLHALGPGAAEFVAALHEGDTVCDAVVHASACAPAFDVSSTLCALVQTGMFASVTIAHRH